MQNYEILLINRLNITIIFPYHYGIKTDFHKAGWFAEV